MSDFFCPKCETILVRFGSRKQENYKCPMCSRFFSRERLEELDDG